MFPNEISVCFVAFKAFFFLYSFHVIYLFPRLSVEVLFLRLQIHALVSRVPVGRLNILLEDYSQRKTTKDFRLVINALCCFAFVYCTKHRVVARLKTRTIVHFGFGSV